MWYPFTRSQKSAGLTVILFALVLLTHPMAEEPPMGATQNSHPVKSSETLMPGFEMKENLCAKADINLSIKRSTSANLEAAIDGQLSTGFDASLLKTVPLQIDFRSRPPWINEVIITHRGEMNFSLAVRDVYRNDKEITYASESTFKGEGVWETKLTCDDQRVTSIAIQPFEIDGPTAEDGIILEVEAYFVTQDPDLPGSRATPKVISEWVTNYKVPCNDDDLRETDDDAESFANGLHYRSGWNWFRNYGNDDAWERDFMLEGSTYDVDEADFVYFSGHGLPGEFKFNNQTDHCWARCDNCRNEWGNWNLEWVALSTCQSLAESQWWCWFSCFNRLHLICGMETNMKDVNTGYWVAKYAGHWNYKRTIKTAWFNGVKTSHGYRSFRKAVVLAEVDDNFNDHVWGEGYVSDDPSHDGTLHYWWLSWGGKGAQPERTFDYSTAELISNPHQETAAFLVPEKLLTRTPPPMLQLNVGVTVVDSPYVEQLKNEFCSYYGLFCDSPVEHDVDENLFAVFDGPHELHVFAETGAWEYEQSETFLANLASAPALLSESDALDSAAALLGSIGFLPADAVPYDAFWFRQGEITDGVEDPSATWNANIAASYARVQNGYQVIGPGADIHAVFGDNGELQSVNYGGWRDVTEGNLVDVITLQEALEDVANNGSQIAIGGMPTCDTFLVSSAELGYYEETVNAIIDELTIVWLVDGLCVSNEGLEGPVTSEYQLVVPALYRHPRGEIIQPPGDTSIPFGDPLQLEGTATGGVSPYTYNWYSDIDGYLGSGSLIEVPSLSMVDSKPTIHTITLEVVDANGATDAGASVSVSVGVDIPPYPVVTIDKTHETQQGVPELLNVSWASAELEMGGFDFLIAYDASALTLQTIVPGPAFYESAPDGCGWEYFTYRYGPSGNCSDACPSGMVRVIGLAETNNGPVHPSCYLPDSLPATLFTLDFLVSNDRVLECQYVPVSFFWTDCGDNTISSVDGEILYVSDHVYDFKGTEITDTTYGFPTYFGVQPECLIFEPDKPNATRFVNFVNGGIDIICADSIDDRGDINLNGVMNEVADAVVFTNYFIYGLAAFTINQEGQIAATDVNADGMVLSVADLTYLIRVIIGDALPIPKLLPITAQYDIRDGILSVDKEMGAAYVVIKGNANPVNLTDNMEMKYAYDSENDVTRALLYSMEKDHKFAGSFLELNGTLIEIEMATYEGATVKLITDLLPTEFVLHQNKPNPFNAFTDLSFSLPVASDVILEIYNITGQKVATVVEDRFEAGTHTVRWDGSNYASGVYMYRITAGEFTDSKKMLLLK